MILKVPRAMVLYLPRVRDPIKCDENPATSLPRENIYT